MEEVKPIGQDVSGQKDIVKTVKELLNTFPGISDRKILFEEIGEASGITFSSDSGPLIMAERRSITDHVFQTCRYPFFVVYRTASSREFQKLQVQGFLDALGKWLCREPVEINGVEHRLTAFPKLPGNRKIISISRENPHGLLPNENKSQDWLLPVAIQYTNELDMW